MREIKFRAIFKENKEVFDVEFLGEKTIKLSCGEWENRELFNVVQYTGLKDKNGREIFEGDVIDDSYVSPLSGERVEKHYKVIYEKAGYNAHMIGSHPFGSTWLEFLSKKREVIGNIYENPELLEAHHE